MNNVQLLGRITKDPQTSYTSDSKAITRFTVAVDRIPDKNGNKQTDFIGCVAFGKTAEIVEKYFGKGNPIAVAGRIQTGSYEKDGHRIYTTDVIADRVEFVPGDKGEGGKPTKEEQAVIPELIPDDEIPFGGC